MSTTEIFSKHSTTPAYDSSTEKTDDSTDSSNATSTCVAIQEYWYIYLGCIGGLFTTGLIVSIIMECALIFWKKLSKPKDDELSGGILVFLRAQHMCEELRSGTNIAGKVIMTAYFLFSVTSWIGYIIPNFTVGPPTYILTDCGGASRRDAGLAIFDVVANVYFFLVLIVRFLASRQRIRFWFEPSTLVDCATIPSAIVAVIFNKEFFGMGFLRSIRFLNIPDILVYVQVLRGYKSIRIGQITCKFVALWFTGAGLFAFIELFGDFWEWDSTQPDQWPPGSTNISYLNAAYFAMVTMATVGYGDVTPQSTIGKVFTCIFILTAVGMFASMIPEIFTLLAHKGPDTSHHRKQPGEKHVVLCGYLDYRTMKNFVMDFNSSTRLDKETNTPPKLIFLNNEKMNLKMRALVKKHPTKCGFYLGDPLNAVDLERARVSSAECVIILCNVNCKRPDEEDTRTIMRVIAVKDYCPEKRCITQLIQYQSKARLKAVPRWRRDYDSCICISELKLGLIAQNCLAPGFCALLTNLITFSCKKSQSADLPSWKKQYLAGAQYEIFYKRFSESFSNLLFSEAVELCFVQLKIILVAIDILDSRKASEAIRINPHEAVTINPTNMYAFVIADSESHADLVTNYCHSCHISGDLAKKCHCNTAQPEADGDGLPTSFSSNGFFSSVALENLEDRHSVNAADYAVDLGIGSDTVQNGSIHRRGSDNEKAKRQRGATRSRSVESFMRRRQRSAPIEVLDMTGLFHWCPTKKLRDVIINRQAAHARRFINHFVICLFAYRDSPIVGLCNFVMPLRSSSFKRDELKDILIICSGYYLEKEWNTLQNFPNVYVLPGSPLNRANLRAVNLPQCSSCVILSAAKSFDDGLEPCLIDKEAVLCTANIRAMPRLSQHKNFSDERESNAGTATESNDVIGDHLNIFTELLNVRNGTFLGRSDSYRVKDDLFMLEGFACGRMFNVSVLDSLVTTTYFNRNTLNFIQAIIAGGNSDELELLFAENEGLPRGNTHKVEQPNAAKSLCRVRRMNITSPPLSSCYQRDVSVPLKFRHLFLNALRLFGIICIGIYRKVDINDSHHDCKRYIITMPPHGFSLDESDLVFVLEAAKSAQSSQVTDEHRGDHRLVPLLRH